MSTSEQNKAVARRFFEAINNGDSAAVVDTYAEDGCLETMGNMLISGVFTKQQIQAAAGQIFLAFPKGLKFTIHSITAEDDRVAIEAESLGQHASGKTYNNRYHFLMRLRDGKIVRFKEYMDTEHATDVLCGGQRPPAKT
jgi:ketosteroid isomerase-like protein